MLAKRKLLTIHHAMKSCFLFFLIMISCDESKICNKSMRKVISNLIWKLTTLDTRSFNHASQHSRWKNHSWSCHDFFLWCRRDLKSLMTSSSNDTMRTVSSYNEHGREQKNHLKLEGKAWFQSKSHEHAFLKSSCYDHGNDKRLRVVTRCQGRRKYYAVLFTSLRNDWCFCARIYCHGWSSLRWRQGQHRLSIKSTTARQIFHTELRM